MLIISSTAYSLVARKYTMGSVGLCTSENTLIQELHLVSLVDPLDHVHFSECFWSFFIVLHDIFGTSILFNIMFPKNHLKIYIGTNSSWSGQKRWSPYQQCFSYSTLGPIFLNLVPSGSTTRNTSLTFHTLFYPTTATPYHTPLTFIY